jgi:hypothetical protein
VLECASYGSFSRQLKIALRCASLVVGIAANPLVANFKDRIGAIKNRILVTTLLMFDPRACNMHPANHP